MQNVGIMSWRGGVISLSKNVGPPSQVGRPTVGPVPYYLSSLGNENERTNDEEVALASS